MSCTPQPRRAKLPSMQCFVLGAGFTGGRVVELALQSGSRVVGTTRDPERGRWLEERGARALVAPELRAGELAPLLTSESRVLVTFPPDGHTDAEIAAAIPRGARVIYISSTAVYGSRTGHVDELTPVQPDTARGDRRHQAEQLWLEAAARYQFEAIVVRAPAIYGPGRGLHLRLARGALKLNGDPTNTISRVHRNDLAHALVHLLEFGARQTTYVVGDLEPAPHIQVVTWLSAALRVPVPALDPSTAPDETLSSNRQVDASRLRNEIAWKLEYPSYREGLMQCIRCDRAELDRLLARRAG